MTVNTTKIASGPYIGNDTADTFSYGFQINDKTELNVFETTDAGVETELVVDTDYTVNGIGDEGGGTIVRLAGVLPTNYTWYIRSDYKETQLTSFGSQGAFFPDIHEDAMDKLTYLIQQVLDTQSRSPALSRSYTGSLPITLPDPIAGHTILWNDELTGFNSEFLDVDGVNQAIVNANDAADNANEAADNANEAVDGFEDKGDVAIAVQEQAFQDRFAFSQPTLPWQPSIVIEDTLQLYSTGVEGESGYSVWLADPNLVPFTTSATFPEDEALGRWAVATVATQSWSTLNAIAKSLNVASSNVMYYLAGAVINAGVMHLHDEVSQVTYEIPSSLTSGEVITSLTGNILETNLNTYSLGLSLNSEVISLQYGGFGYVEGGANNSQPLKDAMAYAATKSGVGVTSNGAIIELPAHIINASGLSFEPRCFLRGQGRGATSLRMPDGANETILSIPDGAGMIGWSGLTFDGNQQNNTTGRCIHVESVGGSDGNSFQPYNQKTETPPYSYKHIIAYDWVAGNASDECVYHEPSNYQIFYDNFVISHGGYDGLSVFSSDGIYSNFYLEKNGRCGLYASGANNKYSNGKVIWNGRNDNTFGNWREQGSHNTFIAVEAQDSYTDGLLILGSNPTFIGCTSNRNGYLAVGSEDQSTGDSADIRIGASASGITFTGSVFTYASAVGSDGKWTTEFPYYFNSFNTAQIKTWNVDYDQTTYNQPPNVIYSQLSSGDAFKIGHQCGNNSNVFADIDLFSPDGAGDETIRVFRNSNSGSTANTRIVMYERGTSTESHSIPDSGQVNFCKNNVGNMLIGDSSTGGRWDTPHLKLGPFHLWIDSTGALRRKGSTPTSDLDGTLIG